jgi:trimeric autotransporter adhesin
VSSVSDFLNSSTSFRRAIYVPVSNQPPTANAGGPYSGNEGSAVAVGGTASDPDAGDTVTTSWSYAVVSADAGASCSFGNAALPATTVTCTDDGTFTLTLTASDGVNPSVTSDATLTVTNVAPAFTAANAATDPTTFGAAANCAAGTTLSYGFTDPGADQWTIDIDWDNDATF